MGKLHELLAVEPDLKAEAQRVVSQVKQLFTEGAGRLIGQTKVYYPLEADGETQPEEVVALATTVQDELEHIESALGGWIDAALQKEITNQDTVATLEIGDICWNLPATALLNLEGKLAELRRVYNAIPTNDPAERWERDEQEACYRARERISYRTKKVPRSHVLYEATEQHPAQVEMYHEDIRVGQWVVTIRSGMLSPREKLEKIQRIDKLIRAVKAARQRANNIEVKAVHFADELFAYLHQGE